jgi:hypothetical protein
LIAPLAKIARFSARCESDSRSLSARKWTVWSPATDPPRRLAKPIAPTSRLPDAVAAAFGMLG